jgi:hypothetical protein
VLHLTVRSRPMKCNTTARFDLFRPSETKGLRAIFQEKRNRMQSIFSLAARQR